MPAESKESITATFVPILSCLDKAEEFLGREGTWLATTSTQNRFNSEYLPARAELEPFLNGSLEDQPLKIESIASEKASEINEFLRKHKFDISLDDFPPPPPRRFGAASVMDVLVHWLVPGEDTKLKAQDNNVYSAVNMKESELVSLFKSEMVTGPVVKLQTKSCDYSVGIVVPDRAPVDGFALLDFVQNVRAPYSSVEMLLQSYPKIAYEYEGVIFPKVDLDQKVDISWLKGMIYNQTPGWEIEEALQQTKFKMNEMGAHAKSAVVVRFVALGMHMPKEPYVIDRPFITWIEKEGLSVPLFAGYINYSDWKDPGNLDL